jgi:hypothetical protein
VRGLDRSLCIVAVALGGCSFGDWSWDEVARVTAPGGDVDAVLIERNGGATTSFGYEVFVVPRGKSIVQSAENSTASLYGAVRSDSAYGANLRWVAGNELAVEYRDSRQASLRDSVVPLAGRSVRVVLRSGVEDPDAPGGGMLYNLQGRPR